MSSTAGMRKARVLPLPVFAAARRSLNVKKGKEETFSILFQASTYSTASIHNHRCFRLQGWNRIKDKIPPFSITEFNHLSKTPNSEVRIVPENRSEHFSSNSRKQFKAFNAGWI